VSGSDAVAERPARDAFPGDRFGALVKRTPRYLRLAWALAGEPRLPRSRKLGVLGAAAYLASPVDLVPGIIPVVGQLDDLAIAMLALRAALRALDEPTRTRLLAESSLTQDDLDADLATIGATAAWLARSGARLTLRLARLAAMAGLAVGRKGLAVAAEATRRGVRAGGSVTGVAGRRASSGAGAVRSRAGAVTSKAGAIRRAITDRSGSPGSGSPPTPAG
jgi:uncharacterized membrane protein YkvA (DUF1232 family)